MCYGYNINIPWKSWDFKRKGHLQSGTKRDYGNVEGFYGRGSYRNAGCSTAEGYYIYKVRIDDMSNIREHHSISCIWTNLRLTVRIPGLRIQPLDQEKSRSVLVNHFAERSNSDALKKTLTITHDILYTLRVLACLVGLYSYLILTKTHENSRFSSYLTGLSLLSVSHGSLLVYLMVPTHENSRKLTIFFVPYGS